ncbi:hypothetical protein DNU06_15530 [Putridiphycobacter roseus]|uniref:Secretion system C-terminal sorting domain-containing protein n=1 Tax=Putridiphycobacter roseus TaxID=2219161 RepID=A0A2W1NMU6_9FLAO|nr:T9SS type A sorting domain-containing protein [Putridiphycobacter roseus]PZE15918.1 hypothetical protein DNU06_15530 [Putridiphycobacter roseus]
MRLITFIAFLHLTVHSIAQIPNYFAHSPSWHCTEAPSGGYTTYNYYLSGNDSVVGGFTYHQLWTKGITPWSTYFNQFKLLVRQDGQSIRYYDANMHADLLLSNYDLVVGDSLKHAHNAVFGDLDTLVVQKIDSIIIGSEYRKQFYFDTLNAGVLITEGIGFQLHENMVEGEFIAPIAIAFGTGYGIHCYGQNASSLWHSDASDTTFCDLDITLGLTAYEKSKIILFPNPASNEITISSAIEIQEITIIAIDGKECLKSYSNKADISSLAHGFYVVKIKMVNDLTLEKSLLVQQ